MTESLQNIERLLNEYMVQLLKRTHGTKDHRERLLSAITRVVQERDRAKAVSIRRFTAYRRNISGRDTHTALQKNPDDEPQFEGVIWSDGSVTLRWLTACRSTSVWANIADCLNIHGHPEYGTEIIWHDGPAPQEWLDQVAALSTAEG